MWGYLFNKSLIKELRFDEETCYLEDTLFLVNYLDKIKTIRFVDNVYYNYNISNSSITRSEDKVKRNILNFCDSLDKINVFLNNKYIDLINNKKIKLIKCELYKLKSSSDLEKIIKSEEFKLIISNLSKQKKIFYTNKIYIDLLSLKKYKIIYNINWCRKKLSHIKKKVLKLFS